MWLGLSGRFRARWSLQIHEEWKRNLLINRPDLTREQVDRTSTAMDQAIPDGLITGYEALIDGLCLPDPNDRHVLAAAIRCNASVIVTSNEKNFPPSDRCAAAEKKAQKSPDGSGPILGDTIAPGAGTGNPIIGELPINFI